MTDGIFESISQGIGREETQENRRIQEIADELRRRCCVYEKEYGTSSSNVNIVLERKVTEEFASEFNLWLPVNQMLEIGEPGPSGNENDTYIKQEHIYKVNNLLALIVACKSSSTVTEHVVLAVSLASAVAVESK